MTRRSVSILLISEASPVNPADYYYAGADALFARTTLLAFQDAGAKVGSIAGYPQTGRLPDHGGQVRQDRLRHWLPDHRESARILLEKEIALFPNVKVYLLMGDVAIKAVNVIAKRNREPRVIPAGSTYKIRGGEFTFRGAHALPSYVQAGPAFFVEKSKRKMIAEDIKRALMIAD